METTRMGFVEAVKTCLKKSFVFTGRARRSEFWWWTLFSFIIGLAVSFVADEIPDDNLLLTLLFTFGMLAFCIYLGIANFAVSTRRLHDIGRSGWWYGVTLIFGVVWTVWMIVKMIGLVGGMDLDHVDVESDAFSLTLLKEMWDVILIPYILYIAYSILLLVWYCKDSQPGANKYGENPKGVVE
ncbi:MAG: DUF805 domain-containing protein [Bacteroidaceae bacterium]|nr:DUF805 domain-containing protein [Bacteroidaceae bacterium]